MALQGVLSAIVTPFSADGETINEPMLRKLVDQSIEDGVHGFVPAGGTGEFSTLSGDERRKLVEIVCEQTAGRVSVMASTGATSTREAIALSKHAEAAGADVLMLATPYYEAVDEDRALAYFGDIAAATSLPLCAYNFPGATGFHLNTDFLVRLAAEVPSVKYVKDSCADIGQMNALLGDHADKITFLIGEDVLLLQSMMLRAPGMVMGIANFVAPGLRMIHEAAQAGDDLKVVDLWRQMHPLIRQMGSANYNAGVKAACEMLGLDVGPVRKPVAGYTEAQKASLKAVLDAMDPALLTGAARR
ncbi:dihydrodipicolinate synthase family protein [Pararhodobacter sp. CCB-MM2]|uniref:dihydrodipicolinate synthase family protein n=1 Tax=Pararhodobacter sp. CCB-MM2 TaxID=1786003 RepID=UPI00082FC9B5|nr:dihydrodipicolinate synthase family protein [Pararhodobacter sp. CCB-MM2]